MAILSLMGTASVGLVALLPAPAAAQAETQVQLELRRASAPARTYCLARTRAKATVADRAMMTLDDRRQFIQRVQTGANDQLIDEAKTLERQVMAGLGRGDDTRDMRPGALGDLIERYRAVATELARRLGNPLRGIEPGDYAVQRSGANVDHQHASRRYETALLDCLDFRDRFPDREWVDPDADASSADFASAPSDTRPIGGGWTPMTPVDPNARPEAPGVDYRVWMTGTFDTGGGVMTLNPAGGRYQASNGRMSTTRIEGNVMEGRWEQDSSGGQCPDGRHWGTYRLTFTATGFTGVFGYCGEVPHRRGGFQGTRRGVAN